MKKRLSLALGAFTIFFVSLIVSSKNTITSDPMTDLLKANIEAFAGIDPTQPPDGGGGPYMIPCKLKENAVCKYFCTMYDGNHNPITLTCSMFNAEFYDPEM